MFPIRELLVAGLHLPPVRAVDRRTFLRGAATALAGVGAAACAPGEDDPADTSGRSSPPPTATASTNRGQGADAADPAVLAAEAVGIDPSTLTWSVILPEPTYVARPDGRFQFAIMDAGRNILGARRDIEFALVSDDGFTPISDLIPAPYVGAELGERGVYLATPTLEPGIHYVVVTDAARTSAGVAIVSVIRPADAPWPAHGQELPAFTSPTFDAPPAQGVLCTQDPICSMHEHSVDTLLADNRPFFLLLATPLYCATAICGPVVSIVDSFREKVAPDLPDDFAWVHHEIFSDEGQSYLPVVTQTLQIPFEPYGFVVNSDGTVHDTFGGVIVADLLEPSVRSAV